MKLTTKLILAFTLLALLVGSAGGFGLWYVNKVAQTVEVFADVTEPLLNETTTLVTTLQDMQIALHTMLQLGHAAEHQTYTDRLNTFATAFHNGVEKLTHLATRGQLALPLEEVVDKQREFVTQAHTMISAHQTQVGQAALATQRLQEFDQHRAQLDTLLADFAKEGEATIAEREDRGKTLTQSGAATVEDLERLLSATLTESYPLVQGAYKLMRYLIQMQESAGTFLATEHPTQLAVIEDNFQKSAKASTTLIKRLKSRAQTDTSKETIEKIVQAATHLQTMVVAENGLFSSRRAALAADASAQSAQEALISASTSAERTLQKVAEIARALNEQGKTSARDRGQQAQMSIGIIVLFSLIIAVLVGTVITRAVVTPIRETSRVVAALAEGDLTQRMEGKFQGEFGTLRDAVNTSLQQLQQTVSAVRDTAAMITTAASEIAQGNSTLSQRTQEQAAALEETASSMEEMTDAVNQSADNARQANQLAAGARVQAEKGGDVVERAVAAMEEINRSNKRIADIIAVIDGIAFQTNLLALNAAVEAARAGEQGRGFAVVAAEVRHLAQRSADAAKEIKGLIMDSVEKVGDGTRLVGDSGMTLDDIVTAVKTVSDMVAGIAVASQEQSAGIAQVNTAVTRMDEMTQHNAALVEEAAAASESLDTQAQELWQRMAFFKVSAEVCDAEVAGTTAGDEAQCVASGQLPLAPAGGKSQRARRSLVTAARGTNGHHPVGAAHTHGEDSAGSEF